MRQSRTGLWLSCLLAVGCGKVSGAAPDAPGSSDAAGGSGPTTITLKNYNIAGQVANTALVAVQDGDGAPWQAITGAAGVYTFPVTGDHYGLATVCARPAAGANSSLNAVDVSFYTVRDGTSRSSFDQCSLATPAKITITGTLTGTVTGDEISIADGTDGLSGDPISPWSISAVAGPGTLIAMRLTGQRPVSMLFQSVSFTANANYPLNFANGFLPTEAGLTLDPTGTSGNLLVSSSYLAADGRSFGIDFSSTPLTTYRVVPDDHIGNGLSQINQTSSDNTASRAVTRTFKTPVAQTLTLPPAFLAMSAPQITATTPYPILSTTLPRRDDALYYQVSYFGSAAKNLFREWSLETSATWIAAAPGNLVVAMPDLSKVAGWDASYALPATGISWTVAAGTGPARALPGIPAYGASGAQMISYQDGDETTRSSSNGSL
jgi:hypothetical protein